MEPEPEPEMEPEMEPEPAPEPSSTAIVPFSENMLFTNPRLLPTRRFAIGEREIVVDQRHQSAEMACDWDAGGSLTGAAVWDASLVLAHYLPRLAEGGWSWGGARVLELGAGAGLLAIAAAQLGASVAATDMDERVLELCAANGVANGVGPDTLTTAILPWGSAAAVAALDVAGTGWDAVLAADCVYPGRRQAGAGAAADRPLLETLLAAGRLRQQAAAVAAAATAATTTGGSTALAPTRVVCGYKTRSVEQLAFFRLAKRKGFEIRWVNQQHIHPDFQVQDSEGGGLPDNPAECCGDSSGGRQLQLGGVHVCIMTLKEI